jgi:ribosomal protein L13
MTFEKVVVVDGRDHLLGRLAGLVAKELVLGQRVVVVRCEELMQSGPSWRNVIKVQKERVKKVGPARGAAKGSGRGLSRRRQGRAGAAARPAATSACAVPCRAVPGRQAGPGQARPG